MADRTFLGVIVVALITVVQCGEWCTDYSYDLFDTDHRTFYCDNGCCGDYDDRYCCVSSKVGMIIGIVVGCLALVALIVTVVVCLVCCRRQRARQGQVVGGGAAVNMTTTTVGAQPYVVTTPQMGYTASYPQGPQPYPQQPQFGNQQFAQPPPSYNDLQPK